MLYLRVICGCFGWSHDNTVLWLRICCLFCFDCCLVFWRECLAWVSVVLVVFRGREIEFWFGVVNVDLH